MSKECPECSSEDVRYEIVKNNGFMRADSKCLVIRLICDCCRFGWMDDRLGAINEDLIAQEFERKQKCCCISYYARTGKHAEGCPLFKKEATDVQS